MNDKHQRLQLSGLLKWSMYVIELLTVNAAFYVFFGGGLASLGHGLSAMPLLYVATTAILSLSYLVGVAVCPISFFYRSSRRGSIFVNVSLTTFVMVAVSGAFTALTGRLQFFDTWRVMLMFATIYVALLLLRSVARAVIQYLRSQGRNVHRVVFVGGSDNLREIYDEMRNPFYGYSVLGYFSDAPQPDFPESLTYLGPVAHCIPYMQDHDVQQLYCSLPSAMADDIRPIITWCENNFVRFFSVPNVRNYLKRRMQVEMLGDVTVLTIREDPLLSLGNRILKRSFDLLVSGLFMIPFWLLIYPVVAVCTKIFQPGPVFFRQKRNGLNGRIFYCYKFRSMKVNADADRLQATQDDPRKTRFGNFLRKSSIDELPQFINVLRGDMSVVGPRPHMVKHTEEYSALIDKYMVRHWVRPGITGWAQVNGARGETRELWQMEDRIRKDIWYVENWSLWLDIRIIFMTVRNAVLGDKQAY